MTGRRWAALIACVLLGATAAPALADPDQATVEVGESGRVLMANESDGFVHVTLTRRGHPGRAIEVQYRTEERDAGGYYAPAMSGADFTATSGTLVFPAGAKDGTVLSFDVPVADDSNGESSESFNVIVESEDAAVSQRATEAVIHDNDPTPEPCHCYISGVKVYGCVPETACRVCCTEPTGVRLTCKEKARMAALFRQNQLL